MILSYNAKPYTKKISTKTTTQSQKIDIIFKQQHPPTGSQSETVVNENEPLKQTQVTENEFAVKNLRKFVFAM